MPLKEALKSFWDGFAKTIGQHAGAFVWTSLVVGGPIVTWFASPTVYSIQLSRLQAATLALVFVLSIALTAWITRWFGTKRRKFYLTPTGPRNIWGTTTLADGSVNAQFSADFVAKNLTDSVQRLISARMVNPRVSGRMVQTLILGPRGSAMELQPAAAKSMTITILVAGAQQFPKKTGDLDVVFAIANDEGYEQRVKVNLRKLAPADVAKYQGTDPTYTVKVER